MRFLYRTRLSGHGIARCCAPDARVYPDGAGVEWAEVAVLLDQPLGVVAGGEGADGVTDLVDGLEYVSADGLLLQRPEELCTAVTKQATGSPALC